MGIINLNSTIVPSEEDVIFAVSRAENLSSYYFNLPVYLVDPDLMDKIYPPERRKFLNPGCVKEIIFSMQRERVKELDLEEFARFQNMLWEKIENCKMYESHFVAIGVYVSYLDFKRREEISEHTDKKIDGAKCIFICPERIRKVVDDIKQEFKIIDENWLFKLFFTKILIHELAHAFMDYKKDVSDSWERLIEESLANAFAYKYLLPVMSNSDKVAIQKFISTQPIEYRGYRYFIDEEMLSILYLEKIGDLWRKRFTFSFQSFDYLYLPSLVFPIVFLLRDAPYSLRHRIFRRLRMELPSPWDDIIIDMLKRGVFQNSIIFWKILAISILGLLI